MASALMTWDSNRNRWYKCVRIDGKKSTIAVSCRQLRIPRTEWTEAGSRSAANGWYVTWEFEQETKERQDAILAERGRQVVDELLAMNYREIENPVHQKLILGRALGRVDERTKREEASGPIITDELDRFDERKRALAIVNEISSDRYASYLADTAYLRKWLSDAGFTSLNQINFDFVEAYHSHVLNELAKRRDDNRKIAKMFRKGCAPSTGKARVQTFLQFLQYLWKKDLIVLPKNANNRDCRIKLPSKQPEAMSIENIVKLFSHNHVEEINGIGRDADNAARRRLYLLLVLNCGFTYADMGLLEHDEVFLDGGRIIHKRTKTGDKEKVPTVNYKLWPEPLELLKRFQSSHEKYFLTTEDGECLYRKWVDADGSAQFRCPPEDALKRLKTRAGVNQTIRAIRKTSNSIIKTDPRYRQFCSLFLGHAPRSTGEKFYDDPDVIKDVPPLLDECLTWLRERYIGLGVPVVPSR